MASNTPKHGAESPGPNPAVSKPDPYAHLDSQRLTGWIGEGSLTAKLSRSDDAEVELDLNVATASVQVYHLDTHSLLEALAAGGAWFASRSDVSWWRLGKKIERSMSQTYELECREGAASVTVKRDVVVFHLPGTVTGTTHLIKNGFVSSKYIGEASITNNVDLGFKLGQLRKVLSRLEVRDADGGADGDDVSRAVIADADSVSF